MGRLAASGVQVLSGPCARADTAGVSGDLRSPVARACLWDTAPGAVAEPVGLSLLAVGHAVSTVGTVAQMWAEIGRRTGLDMPRLDARDWWLTLEWDAPNEALSPDAQAHLCLDGLATYAQVWLNGQAVLESRNMFVSHRLLVASLLQPGLNRLVCCVRALDAALQARFPRPRWRAPMIEHQQLRHWRTSVLGRTPGWSPSTPVVGPWRRMALEWGWPGHVSPFDVRQARLDATCTLGDVPAGRLTVRLPVRPGFDADGGVQEGWRIEVRRLRPDGSVEADAIASASLAQDVAGREAVADLSLPGVSLWWPHTHGQPVLHEVRLVAAPTPISSSSLDESARSQVLGRVGFRHVAVHRENGDFALEVNGHPVFARGACWTPLNSSSPDRPADEYRRAVAQVRDAGMNMLRVGGTMVYEPAAFFDACDEAGVLVWQEFMFANMDFPDQDAAWLASVEIEARQQLALWRSHPSVAVLCGNSEVEQQAAMWGAPREQWHSPLFHEHLPRWVAQDMLQAVYWPSSAHGGAFPHAVDAGTTSCYSVGAYLRPLEDARRQAPVWASECLAFANVPAPATIERMPGGSALRVTHPGWKQRSPRDLGAGWDFDDVRDHYLERLFGEDARTLRYSDHERYLLLSRIASGEVMAQTLVEWRRPGGRCRGAFVWFLRDLWAGAGWGLLDDQGLPKACWHLLRRVLSPQTVLWSDEGHSGLYAHLINERPEPATARLCIDVWQSRQAMSSAEVTVHVPARGHVSVAAADCLDHFTDLTDVFRFGPRRHEAVRARWIDPDGVEKARHWYWPGQGRHTVLDEPVAGPDAVLSATARRVEHDGVEVSVTARRLLRWIHFDVPGWIADDDHFHLAPGETRTVTLHRLPAPAVVPRVWRGLVSAVNLSAPAVIQFKES